MMQSVADALSLQALNCPHSAANAPGSPGSIGLIPPDLGVESFWQEILAAVLSGAAAIQRGDFDSARAVLADALLTSTGSSSSDPGLGFTCSLGVAAAYRVLAVAFFADPRFLSDSWAFRRAHQIALRFQHLANVWVTHVWEKFARREDATGMAWYDTAYIDDSVWPISIRDINIEMTAVQDAIAQEGRAEGHPPRWPGVPHDFRDPGLRLGIVSLCAYSDDHVLPKYAGSNHRIYAARHGYRYHVATKLLDASRPPAWSKVALMHQALAEPDVDWWLWFDCDTFFMNMSVTLDSLLYRYGHAQDGHLRLDPAFHMFVAEDNAMLNTGALLLRSSDWSRNFLRRAWGPDDSVWTHHPWWENAAILWDLLKDNSEKFRSGLLASNLQGAGEGDDLDDIYPAEVRLMPQAEFNSYHPSTSHFMHDTWVPGKFALAFNGVLSNTSPEVIRVLYGNYYELACELNDISAQCVKVEVALPWL